MSNNALMQSQAINQPVQHSGIPHAGPQAVPPVMSSHFPSVGQDIDLRNVVDPRLNRNMDMDMRSMGANPTQMPNVMDQSFMRQQGQQRPIGVTQPFQTDPRQRIDPRVKAQANVMVQQPCAQPQSQAQSQSSQQAPANRIPSGIPSDASDQEKAALIMQVLQLSDEQISMLPPEQRDSILTLKEQIARSAQR